MVTSVTSSTVNSGTTAASATGAAASGVSLAKNFDTFLKLLTTQLKNQDPTSPMDSKEFTQQLVQFSQVEQEINQNKNLEKLLSMFQAQNSNGNLGFIGKDVVVAGSQSAYAPGGKVDWKYDLPVGTASAKVNVYDEAGKVVYTQAVDPKAGRADFAWDGSRTDGAAQKAGNYRLEVLAKDGGGKALDGGKTFVTGHVTSLDYENGEQFLMLGTVKVKPSDVISVRQPA